MFLETRNTEAEAIVVWICRCYWGRTFPTAASPSSTSFTLLLGLGCESAMAEDYVRV